MLKKTRQFRKIGVFVSPRRGIILRQEIHRRLGDIQSMIDRQLGTVVRYIRQVAHRPDLADESDARLLERFTTRHDGEAFDVLICRHGAMVWGVCRRVLNASHDAEDAFQSTFLVLARKKRIGFKGDSVGNWLYGVAYRTALKARAVAARRRAKEMKVAAMSGTAKFRPADCDMLRDAEIRELR